MVFALILTSVIAPVVGPQKIVVLPPVSVLHPTANMFVRDVAFVLDLTIVSVNQEEQVRTAS